jgi:hypothetical protein
MDVTIGYGGASVRETSKAVFVVQGCESAAVVGDEGWEEIERAFFVGGAVLDHNAALLPAAASRRRLWLWAALAAGGLLLGLGTLLVLARPAAPVSPAAAAVQRGR